MQKNIVNLLFNISNSLYRYFYSKIYLCYCLLFLTDPLASLPVTSFFFFARKHLKEHWYKFCHGEETVMQLCRCIYFPMQRANNENLPSELMKCFDYTYLLNVLKWVFSPNCRLQSWREHLQTFSRFGRVSLHHKWNWTKLLSPKKEICELTHKLPNHLSLTILGNRNFQERKSLKWLGLMTGTQPVTRKPNFDINGKNLLKISCKTFHRKTCFA